MKKAFLFLLAISFIAAYWYIAVPVIAISAIIYFASKNRMKKQAFHEEDATRLLNSVEYFINKINSTTSPISFEMYYKALVENLEELIPLERHIEFIECLPSDNLKDIQDNKLSAFEKLVKRACIKAEQESERMQSYSEKIEYLEKFVNGFRYYKYSEFAEALYPINDFDITILHPLKNMAATLSSIKDGYEFEKYIANLLLMNGFDKATTTKKSGDYGIDVLAEKNGIIYAVQCKLYNNQVGPSAIQEAATGKNYYEAHVPIVVTNSIFTKSAKELAKKVGVVLWDGNILTQMASHMLTDKVNKGGVWVEISD